MTRGSGMKVPGLFLRKPGARRLLPAAAGSKGDTPVGAQVPAGGRNAAGGTAPRRRACGTHCAPQAPYTARPGVPASSGPTLFQPRMRLFFLTILPFCAILFLYSAMKKQE